jgi:hypothetical protein
MLPYALDQPYIPQRMLVSLDTGKLIDNMNDLMKLYAPRLLLQVLTLRVKAQIPTRSLHLQRERPDETLRPALQILILLALLAHTYKY